MPLVLGIDPGKQGAIASVELAYRGLSQVIDMPPTVTELARVIAELNGGGGIAFALIEDVSGGTYTDASGALRGQGSRASFTFGRGVGELHGVLAAHNIRVRTIKPAVWKALYALSSNKKDSLALARLKFPEFSTMFARAKDDGRAEASLLALFGAERFT